MKKKLLLLGMLFLSGRLLAADTLFVHAPQIPILTNQQDNVLYEIRINAEKGDVLNQLVLNFDEINKEEVAAVRLYYSGVEGTARKGDHTHPTALQAKALPSVFGQTLSNGQKAVYKDYSVCQDEQSLNDKKVVLSSQQPLLKGKNYFWVSIQMKPTALLTNTFTATLSEATVNQSAAIIQSDGEVTAQRRLGYAVRNAWDDGVAAYRIPGIVTSNEGTLVGCYDVRYHNSVDLQEKIDIGVSRSEDKGQTWEPMRIAMTFKNEGGLPHAQNGVGDPSILVDEKTNTLWIVAAWCHGMGNQRAWFNSQQGMSLDETAQLMLVKSEDDGRTWSKPINITEQVKDPSWNFLLQGPGRGITMQDGTLVFPIQFIDSERMPHAGIMYSKDRGEHWTIHNPARSNTTEAQVAEVAPGILMLNMRDNRGGSRAVSITKDLGQTWEEHVSNRSALIEPVCMASLIHVDASKNVLGKDLLLFSNPNSDQKRNHITIKASLDGGVTWKENHQLLLDEDEGWGYSCLTMIDAETVGILYESSVAHMTFQAVKLKDLVKNE